MRNITFVLLLCWSPFFSSYGQSDEYIFSHLNVAGGLSNNHITSLFKDAKGFMWFGTMSGLNRYDGYQFRIFRHDQRDTNSLSDNYIEQIFEGPGGKLWIESRAGRFNIYDFGTERFSRDYIACLKSLSLPESWLIKIIRGKDDFWFIYRDNGIYHLLADGRIIPFTAAAKDGQAISAAMVVTAGVDGDGNCWIVHRDGLLEKIDGRTNTLTFSSRILSRSLDGDLSSCKMYIDKENDIWFYSNGVFGGALYYRPATNEIRRFSEDSRDGRLNNNVVIDVLEDSRRNIWLATDHGGVNIVDKRNFSVRYIKHTEDDDKSLVSNSIGTMYRDNTGTIWLGSLKNGISYYHQDMMQFPQYHRRPSDPYSLPYNDINSFVEDRTGNIWIGTNGGGLIYFDRRNDRFRQYRHDPRNPNSLSNDIIVSMLLDRNNKLWIGTYFGGLNCFDGKTFTHYRHDDKIAGSLADDRVMCIYEDSRNDLWIGTLAGGMDRMDPNKAVFNHYNSNNPGSIRNNYVSSIIEDDQKNLWVATAYGIDVMEKSNNRFVHYSSDSNRLGSDNVITLLRDSLGNMWAGTREGLNLFDPVKKQFQSYGIDNGLPDNTIRSIVEDRRYGLWIGTPNGLSRLPDDAPPDRSLRQLNCKNYHESDGLQGREFNEKAALVTRDGTILFGGPNGFNIFDPSQIVHRKTNNPIVLTDLQLFNKIIQPGEKVDNHVILNTSLTDTKEIVLQHTENEFSIEFASLDFIGHALHKYAYKLEGFNKNWLTIDGKIHKASYTNLDPGEYTFHVKASDEDGEWNNKEASLKIMVLPPFWKTSWAYILYYLAAAAILLFSRSMIIRRARMRFALEQERREARQLHEVDLMKIRFFTNMSHELRTPLSLILAPVEKLISHPGQTEPAKQYEMIRRNARRLLHLVNQLLDFRKMEVNELRLQPRQGNIMKFIKEISLSFIDLAERKNISFSYQAAPDSLFTLFDHDKLERILFNLLSNAFKFTPENGNVRVSVNTIKREPEETVLQIKIRDTGIGIARDKQEKIFERFFQTELPHTMLNQGSGIGLAITQEFVKMHNGTLTVDSELNKGSCFTITLPFKELLFLDAHSPVIVSDEEDTMETLPELSPAAPPAATAAAGIPGVKKSTILIVEDNEDFLFYMKDNLRASYHIQEASNGKEGWRKALSLHPDLIVSDISMPVMNGIDLCRKLKSDERTRHIPVILLTALAAESNELESLQTGAADYISKPFNFEVLQSKIRNILDHQETIKKTYQRQVEASPAPVEASSADDQFLQSVLQQIEKNMANAEFSVEELSQQMHTSRSSFYKRLLMITGKTPVEFIRHIRLKKAAELLEKSQMTISEIAYAVGFNNPKYFTQQFRLEFDIAPSLYRTGKKQKMDS